MSRKRRDGREERKMRKEIRSEEEQEEERQRGREGRRSERQRETDLSSLNGHNSWSLAGLNLTARIFSGSPTSLSYLGHLTLPLLAY